MTISDKKLDLAFEDWCPIESDIANCQHPTPAGWPDAELIHMCQFERVGFGKGYIAALTDLLDEIGKRSEEPDGSIYLKLKYSQWSHLLKLRYDRTGNRDTVLSTRHERLLSE